MLEMSLSVFIYLNGIIADREPSTVPGNVQGVYLCFIAVNTCMIVETEPQSSQDTSKMCLFLHTSEDTLLIVQNTVLTQCKRDTCVCVHTYVG